ncbi:MAG: GNVR domain-containing protein [Acidobacteriaceae bacterium]
MIERAVAPHDPPVAGHAADEREISLLDLGIIIAENKRMVLNLTAAFAILAIIVSLLLPVSYTATTTLLPPQEGGSMAGALASQLGSLGGMAALAGGGLGLKNSNDRYVAMFQSRVVEDAMVQKFGLMREYRSRYLSDARKAFESQTLVDGGNKDGLIHISVQDHDANRAAELTNGYVDQFRDLSEHLAISEASQRRLFFQRELEQAKNNLADAEEALEQTELKTGVIQPDSQERALIESATSLRAQITAREVQVQGLQTYATSENSELVQAQQELTGLRAQLAKLGGSEDSHGNEILIPKGLVPKAGMEYVRGLRDVKYYETIFDILARQFEVAKLDEAKEGALIQVVDPAIVPDRKSGPKRSLIVIGATAFGFFLGVVVALFRGGYRRLTSDPAAGTKVATLRRALGKSKPGVSN